MIGQGYFFNPIGDNMAKEKCKKATRDTTEMDQALASSTIEKIKEYLGYWMKEGDVKIEHLWCDRYRINIRDSESKIILRSFFIRANLDGVIYCNPPTSGNKNDKQN